MRGESSVQDSKLLIQGSLSKVAAAERGGSGKDVPVDVDLDGGSTSSIAINAGIVLLELKALRKFDLLLRRMRSTAGTLGESGGGGRKGGDKESLELHVGGETEHLTGTGLSWVG